MDFEGCVVATWLDARGFGFIRLPDGREVFVHLKEVRRAGLDKLRQGERFDVDIAPGPDGRLRVSRLVPCQLRKSAAAAAALLSR